MTQLLTTRSNGGSSSEVTNIIEQTSYPKLDYANSFFLNTKTEKIKYKDGIDGNPLTKEFNVITIPCDGVVQYMNASPSSCAYYKYENPSPWYNSNTTNASDFFQCIGKIPGDAGTPQTGLPVSQGDKFIIAWEISETNRPKDLLMVPYVGVDISFKTKLIYWDYPAGTTIKGGSSTVYNTNPNTGYTTTRINTWGNAKLTTKTVPNNTNFDELIQPNNMNVNFTRSYSGDDVYWQINDDCTFAGWYPSQRDNIGPLSQEQLYDENGNLKYHQLYAIYKTTSSNRYFAAFDK